MSDFGYRGPTVDHSLLSPDGHMSKRARDAAIAREGARLFAGVDLNPPAPQPSPAERLLRQAAQLRELAARGFRPKYHIKHAEKCEAEARLLQTS